MLDLVVLLTVFVGLLGVLLVVAEWRRRRGGAKSPGPAPSYTDVLGEWLKEQRCELSSLTQHVVDGLNKLLAEKEGEDWKDVRVTGLLRKTAPPQFTVLRLTHQSWDRIEFVTDVEWPQCVPGVGVVLTGKGAGQEVTCYLQVDWMYAQFKVSFSQPQEGRGLQWSLAPTSPPQLALSLLVLHPQPEQDPEKLASSVADAIHQAFVSLRLEGEPLACLADPSPPPPLTTLTTLPTLLLSTPDQAEHTLTTITEEEVTGEGVEGVEGGHVSEDSSVLASSSEASLPSNKDTSSPEEQSPSASSHTPSDHAPSNQVSPTGSARDINKPPDLVLHSVKSDDDDDPPAYRSNDPPSDAATPSPPSHHSPPSQASPPSQLRLDQQHDRRAVTLPRVRTAPVPLSPSWRRSPSYEKLQHITEFEEKDKQSTQGGWTPVANDNLNGGGLTMLARDGRLVASSADVLVSSPGRRALTLSTTGSDAESNYSFSDSLYPSLIVFEVREAPSLVRHLVALSPAHANKLKKQLSHYKKLHIYSDHSFVAQHLKQHPYCNFCKQKISGLLGKQGYACRDCGMIVHKKCHCKVEALCAKSKVPSMKLTYPDSVSTASTS